jgi:glycosyltransferase involved in cell wall biosynthesis
MTASGDGLVILTNDMARKGGTNRVIADLIWSLSPQVDIALITLDGDPSSYVYPPAVPVIPIEGLRFLSAHRALRAVRSLAAVPRLGRILRDLAPRVVMSFLARANIANVLAKSASGLSYRTVLCERNYNIAQYRRDAIGQLFLVLMRATYRRADLIVANSHGLAASLRRDFGVLDARIRVIYNPFDLNRIEEMAAAGGTVGETGGSLPVIICVGRLERHKNQAMLLRAFAVVGQTVPCRLQLVGDGPMLRSLVALASSLGVSDGVEFTGWVDNPFPLLRRAAVSVLASDFEGFPSALVEAMACGCPVVTTDCPSGPREITLDGACGLLVPVRDEAALTAALRHVLTDTAFAAELGARGAARARDFDIDRVLEDFRAVMRAPEQGLDQAG